MQLSDSEYVQVTRHWLMGVQGAGHTAAETAFATARLDNDGGVGTAVLTQVTAAQVKVAAQPTIAINVSAPALTPSRNVSTPKEDGADRDEIHRILDLVAQKPDVRDTVVASLRARIESGEYHVSGDEIAQMMLRRFLADTLS